MNQNDVAKHIHEFGEVDNIVHIDMEIVPKLVQKPTIHQYVKDGKIHRTKDHRAVDQFELFLDLIMVGVVHLMAENAAEDFSGLAVARFVLTFWGAWSIWSDYRNYANISGMDDFPQRIYIFVVMALLIGYTANSTGFGIEHGHFENGHIDFVSLKATCAFLLVAKLIKFILFVFYGLYLPEHLMDQWSHAGVILVASAFYLGSMFAPNINLGAVLFGVAGIIENLSIFLGSFIGHLMMAHHKRNKKRGNLNYESHPHTGSKFTQRIALINIEHATERNGGVYTIVLGESITSLLYTVSAYPEAAGINPFYGRAFMVLMVSYCFNWLYFTIDWSVHKTHPIRRHWLTANLYTFLHWPLCSGLVLSSAGVVHLVRDRTTAQGARWYWGGGSAVAVLALTVLDILPRWDFWTNTRMFVFFFRVVTRIGLVCACALLPLVEYHKIDNLQFLGIYASLFAFVMIFELTGKVCIFRESRRIEKELEELEKLHPELKHNTRHHHRKNATLLADQYAPHVSGNPLLEAHSFLKKKLNGPLPGSLKSAKSIKSFKTGQPTGSKPKSAKLALHSRKHSHDSISEVTTEEETA